MIVSIIITILVSGTSFFVIRKILKDYRLLKLDNDWLNQRHDLDVAMKQDYKNLLIEKAMRAKKDEEFINTVKNADGSDLADLANSL